MKNLVIISFLFLMSCTFNKKVDTTIKSDYCIEIDNTDKILCFDMPLDTNGTYIYINEFGVKNIYSNLKLHYMMVVEKKNNIITLSNMLHSVNIEWKGELPNIQDMFYIISTEKALKESVLVKYPEYMIPQDEAIEGEDVEIVEP